MKIRIFKSKEKKRQFLMTIFLFMIFGSVFAFTFGTAFLSATSQPKVETEQDMINKFSKKRIFDENLTDKEKWFLISRGITIATYYYNTTPEFFELEEFVDILEGQLILERIKANETKLELVSARNSEILENLSKENLFNALCDVLYYPPPDCSS
jgi:hypothetical protein